MVDLQPSDDARQAYESAVAARTQMESVRADAEREAQLLELAIDRNHFADKLKAIIYGRTA